MKSNRKLQDENRRKERRIIDKKVRRMKFRNEQTEGGRNKEGRK
jgi:hypothetical protein